MNALLAIAASTLYVSTDVSHGDDDEDEDEPESDGSEDEGADESPKPKKKKGSKKVKKGSKKSSKSEKSESKSSKTESKDVVRLKDLAKQAKLTEAVCRKKLRDADVPRGEGRWSWNLGSRELKAARKALGLG